jgi:hypothetical protein
MNIIGENGGIEMIFNVEFFRIEFCEWNCASQAPAFKFGATCFPRGEGPNQPAVDY